MRTTDDIIRIFIWILIVVGVLWYMGALLACEAQAHVCDGTHTMPDWFTPNPSHHHHYIPSKDVVATWHEKPDEPCRVVTAKADTTTKSPTADCPPVELVEDLFKIRIVSGDRQNGVQGETLPEPLVVEALTQADLAVTNARILFSVLERRGKPVGNIDGEGIVEVLTGNDGRASVSLTLGTGIIGAVKVQVSAKGLAQQIIMKAYVNVAAAPAVVRTGKLVTSWARLKTRGN